MARKIGAPVYALPEDISEVTKKSFLSLTKIFSIKFPLISSTLQVKHKMVMTVYASLMLADMKWKIPNSLMKTSPNVKKKIFVGHKSHQTGCNMNCHLAWSKSVCIKVAPLKIQTRDFVIMIYNGIKHLSDFLLLLWYRALIHFHNWTSFFFLFHQRRNYYIFWNVCNVAKTQLPSPSHSEGEETLPKIDTLDVLGEPTTTTLRTNLENQSWQPILTINLDNKDMSKRTKIRPEFAKNMPKICQADSNV